MPVSAVDRLPTADKAKYETYLQKFETNRNHYKADARQNLENATQYVREKFETAGLKVSLQNFTTSITTTGQVCSKLYLLLFHILQPWSQGLDISFYMHFAPPHPWTMLTKHFDLTQVCI